MASYSTPDSGKYRPSAARPTPAPTRVGFSGGRVRNDEVLRDLDYPPEVTCFGYLSRCYVVLFHCKCNETLLPIAIGATKRTVREFRDDMQHQYTRFTQASQLLAYWPIAVGFILGILGVIQSNIANHENSLNVAKSFGAAQAIIGLASTLSVGIASQIKARAEARLRECIDEGVSVGYFQARDKNDILRKLGLQAKTYQRNGDENEDRGDDNFDENFQPQDDTNMNRPPTPGTRAKNMLG